MKRQIENIEMEIKIMRVMIGTFCMHIRDMCILIVTIIVELDKSICSLYF